MYNEQGALGSPGLLLKAAQDAGIETAEFYFMEKNEQNYRTLKSNLAYWSMFNKRMPRGYRITPVHGECQSVIPDIVESWNGDKCIVKRWNGDKWRFGMVYCDPNGYLLGKAFPVPEFFRILSWNPKMKDIEFLAHISATAYIRSLESSRSNLNIILEDSIRRIRKQFIYIQRDLNGEGATNRWFYLLCSNWSGLKAEKYGFHDINSRKGTDILKELSYKQKGK